MSEQWPTIPTLISLEREMVNPDRQRLALLEIASAALDYRRPIETEQDARDSLSARRRLDAALARFCR